MKWFYSVVKSLYEKKVHAVGLAIFRIFYSFMLLCEVGQVFYFRNLIFDDVPFLEPGELDFSAPLVCWMIVLVCMLFGLYTRQLAILNYLFSLIFFSTIGTYEYHMFYVYIGLNFILMFMDVSQVLSIDRIRFSLKYSNTRFRYVPTVYAPVLNYYILVLVGIAFIYFDSIFYKTMANLWTRGLGVWLPSSIPQAVYFNHISLLNQKELMLFLGYLTLVFEILFIFLFWFRRTRLIVAVIGIGLHFGILLVYPIPWFALGFIAIYMLLVPIAFWRRLYHWVVFKNPQITFYYDEQCPLCNRTVIVLRSLDWLKAVAFKGVQTYSSQDAHLAGRSEEVLLADIHSVSRRGTVRSGVDTYLEVARYIPVLVIPGVVFRIPGLYHLAKYVYSVIAGDRITERCTEDSCGYVPPVVPLDTDGIKILRTLRVKELRLWGISFGFAVLCLLQLISIYNSPLVGVVTNVTGFSRTGPGKQLGKLARGIQKQTKIYLGITGHTVFLDQHFEGYNHIIAIEYRGDKRVFLPIINENGNPASYLLGPTWAKWSFRVNGPVVSVKKLESGVRDFTAFWMVQQGLKFDDEQNFAVLVKRIDTPEFWVRDFLKKQLEKPWKEAGSATWKNGEFSFSVKDIEAL